MPEPISHEAPATTETRINWYHSPLDKDVLRQLTERRDWRGCCQLLPQLLLTAATGAGAYFAFLHLPWPYIVCACYLHATVFAFWGLAGAGHELCHGTVFKTRWLNECFLVLVAFLSWTNFVYFRASHKKHHQLTVHAGLDLEVVLPLRLSRRDWLYAFTANVPAFFFVLATVIRHSRGIIRGEWEERIFPVADVEGRRALARWARVLLLGHLALAALFLAFHLWPLLLLVTFAPFYAGWLNFLCGFPQHVGLQPSVPDFRLCCRTMTLNPFLRFLYWQMNYHVEHHMYAAVPFFNLGKLRAAIADDLPPAYPGLLAAWREIQAILRRQADDPDYVFIPPLPGTK